MEWELTGRHNWKGMEGRPSATLDKIVEWLPDMELVADPME